MQRREIEKRKKLSTVVNIFILVYVTSLYALYMYTGFLCQKKMYIFLHFVSLFVFFVDSKRAIL